MFDAETVTFLEGGCSLIVSVTLADGAPYAARGWGLEVRNASDPAEVRLILGTRDTERMPEEFRSGRLAVTGADVLTLRSLQIKGRTSGLEPAGVADLDRVERYCDAFFADVFTVDGHTPEVMRRLLPGRFSVCTIAVEVVFDQTPGPDAGSKVEVAR